MFYNLYNRLMHEGKIPQNEFGITDFQPFFFDDYPQDHYPQDRSLPPGSLPPDNCSLDNSFMGRGPNTTTLKKLTIQVPGPLNVPGPLIVPFFIFQFIFHLVHLMFILVAETESLCPGLMRSPLALS